MYKIKNESVQLYLSTIAPSCQHTYRVDDLVKEQIRKILLSLVIFKYTKKIVGNKIFVLWYLNYLRL